MQGGEHRTGADCGFVSVAMRSERLFKSLLWLRKGFLKE